jgi:hypothetical protein
MKKTRKILALVLAVVLAISMSVSAFAATTGTISVSFVIYHEDDSSTTLTTTVNTSGLYTVKDAVDLALTQISYVSDVSWTTVPDADDENITYYAFDGFTYDGTGIYNDFESEDYGDGHGWYEGWAWEYYIDGNYPTAYMDVTPISVVLNGIELDYAYGDWEW